MSPRRKNVVLLQADRSHAELLADSLHHAGFNVVTACSQSELFSVLRHESANFAIVDLDVVSMSEVPKLRSEFELEIVCTHRVADERMWAAALNAGALDCCYPNDVRAITSAVKEKSLTAAA